MIHYIKGELPIAFVTLASRGSSSNTINKNESEIENYQKIRNDLKNLIRQEIAGFAIPGKFYFTNNLPKTRSGKIMRRILKKLANGEDDISALGDLSTLADPDSVGKLMVDMTK